jgi:hypothetical protein
MGIALADLIGMSPCLYHVTYEDGLGRIRRSRRLESAAALMDAGGQISWSRKRRDTMLRFLVDDDPIVLTDQLPINVKNIAFQDGWTLPDLIESINRRVFFWRGSTAGLLRSNQGHFGKYENAGHRLVFLRLNFDETSRLNAERGPELCKHNSGAQRDNMRVSPYLVVPRPLFDHGMRTSKRAMSKKWSFGISLIYPPRQ